MSQMIIRGSVFIRISPKDSKKLEYSNNEGRFWMPLFNGNTQIGNFIDLTDAGKEILAQTSTGLCYSNNEGRFWMMRKRN